MDICIQSTQGHEIKGRHPRRAMDKSGKKAMFFIMEKPHQKKHIYSWFEFIQALHYVFIM